MVLTQITRSRFKLSKISLLVPYIYDFRLICSFFGDFWVYSGINSFSQKISKIDGNWKFGRFDVVLKLKFEVKNL